MRRPPSPLFLLTLPLALSCAPSRTARYDLADLSRTARVLAETAILDLGTREARTELVSGWSADERATDDTSFVWATGASSSLRLFIGDPRPVEISFRCWPFRFPGAPQQRLSLSLNGGPLGDLPLADSAAEYRLALPETLQVAGENVLRIDSSYNHSPRESLQGATDPRSLSAGWDWLRMEGAVISRGPFANGEGLALPYGVRVEYILDVPRGSRLEIESVRPFGEESDKGYLGISYRTLSSGDDWRVPRSVRRVEFPLASEEGLVALSFQARTGSGRIPGEGGLLLRRPVVFSRSREEWDSPSPSSRPNVILVLVDTLRADHLGCYGYGKGTSPNIDRLAREAALFETAYAQSSWTRPSAASILSGLLPRSHTANGRDDALPAEAVTLAERLASLGYRTAGFVTNANVAPEFGFAQGFSKYELLLDENPEIGYARAEVLVDRALSFLEEPGEQPFFLYLHATDPHDPYTFSPGGRDSVGSRDFMEALEAGEIRADPPTREKLLALYDEKIRYVDRELGRFFERLENKGLYQNALIVLLSDHGEEFEEHGWWRHGKTLYQEQLHVPFLLKLPGAESGRRIGAVAQHVDLVPTVLDFLGVPAGDDLPGKSLRQVLEGGSASEPAVSSYLLTDGREVESIVYRERKLVRTLVYDRDVSAFALFDLTSDPEEKRNLADPRPAAFELLDSLLLRPIPGGELTPLPAAIDESTRKRLEALGYIR